MYRKAILSFVFGIGMVAILGTESVARVCTLKSSSGTCLFWSGSVECDLNADQVGSLKDNPELSCTVTPSSVAESQGGLLLCGNPGRKQKPASGIQVISIPAASSPPSFGASIGIQKQNIQNGVATVPPISASPNLSQFNSFCPNPSWVVLDYVPCQASIEAKQSDTVGPIDTKTFSCTLPSCSTLGFDPVTGKFERRQYQCTQQ